MELSFDSILVRKIVGVSAHPMMPGHYALRSRQRYSDGFIYVRNGHAHYTFDNQEFDADKGCVFYLSYLSQYDIDVDEGYDVAYIDCMLDAPEGAYESACFPLEDSSEVERMLLRLERKWVPQSTNSRLLAFSTLYELFGILAQERAAGYLSTDNRARMRQARDIITQRYKDKDFSCMEMGESFGMSDVHFRRLFTQMYGITPSQYLTAMRIRAAKSLLLRTAASVSEIAEESGYRSVYYFCRAFKRETDVTPTEYRRNAF